MKIPEPKQLPSGTWFVRVYSDGVSTSISDEDYYVCKAKAMALKTGIIQDKKQRRYPPLKDAIDNYIAIRENVLSPSTIRGYKEIKKSRFNELLDLRLEEITKQKAQQACNLEAKKCSAKTLTNAWRFISSVIYEETGERIAVRLPQVIIKDRPFLDSEQIKVFVNAVKGTEIEITGLLALSSLRRSEIKALEWKNVDLDAGLIYVRGAAVLNEHGELVTRRENKNATSRRDVPIIPQLKEALKRVDVKKGFVVPLHIKYMYTLVNKVCEENGLPKVGLHGLRHSFASLAYYLGIPEKVAMEIGGWANDQTMHKIYTHVSRKSRTLAENAMTQYYSNL